MIGGEEMAKKNGLKAMYRKEKGEPPPSTGPAKNTEQRLRRNNLQRGRRNIKGDNTQKDLPFMG